MYKKNFQKNLPNKSQPSKTLSDINHSKSSMTHLPEYWK